MVQRCPGFAGRILEGVKRNASRVICGAVLSLNEDDGEKQNPKNVDDEEKLRRTASIRLLTPLPMCGGRN